MIHPLIWCVLFVIGSFAYMVQARSCFQDKEYEACFPSAWASLLFLAIAFSWAMKFLIKGFP